MPEPTTDLTITVDGPYGYRSWMFTAEQLQKMNLTWRETTVEEINSIVSSEIDRMAR